MKVHPKTVYRWIKTGKFEAIRFGTRTYRIPERTVNDYLQKNGFSHLIGQGGEQ
jgi:excisionase family DNA binding protein